MFISSIIALKTYQFQNTFIDVRRQSHFMYSGPEDEGEVPGEMPPMLVEVSSMAVVMSQR